jgi:hypothetical protein
MSERIAPATQSVRSDGPSGPQWESQVRAASEDAVCEVLSRDVLRQILSIDSFAPEVLRCVCPSGATTS